MSSLIAPTSVKELSEAVRTVPQLLPVGAETKKRLSAVAVPKISTLKLRGIVEYEPTEFTFTALAGTPLAEISEALAASGQHLPFDPLLVEAGATLGGTVAAGLNGPGRFRYGGLRDFILGVRFVDGSGRILRVGGKVVKNAAGFDLPKFFVGSLGRFGILADITIKVFPKPESTLSLELEERDIERAAQILVEAARARWELDALDLLPGGQKICLRLAGPAEAANQIANEILTRWPGNLLSAEEAGRAWAELRELSWTNAEGPVLKVVVRPTVVPGLSRALSEFAGIKIHVSAGGNVAFVSLKAKDQIAAVSELLTRFSLPALMLRGEGPLWCGPYLVPNISQAVKQALDPHNRFPAIDQ